MCNFCTQPVARNVCDNSFSNKCVQESIVLEKHVENDSRMNLSEVQSKPGTCCKLYNVGFHAFMVTHLSCCSEE
jgi:hypothetical protein